jgi:putative membrane protein
MGWFFVNWLTNAAALGVVAWILPGVTIASLPALAVAAIVLGIVNSVVKPVLLVLTLPLTVMTLGVFYFIVNGMAFALAAWIVPGFEVRSLVWAMLGAALVGLVSMFIDSFRQPPQRTRVDVIDVTAHRD